MPIIEKKNITPHIVRRANVVNYEAKHVNDSIAYGSF
jgi:hypothetical protein